MYNEQGKTTYKCLFVMYYLKRKKKVTEKVATKKKRKPNLVAKLDRIFSKYIRLRDVMPNGYFMCISCGRIKPYEKGDCGHFFSRKHMATRFDEDNCSAECRSCNRFSADHLASYQVNLVRKIGQNRFEKLVWKHNSTKKWCDFELEEMIEYYTKQVKELLKVKCV